MILHKKIRTGKKAGRAAWILTSALISFTAVSAPRAEEYTEDWGSIYSRFIEREGYRETDGFFLTPTDIVGGLYEFSLCDFDRNGVPELLVYNGQKARFNQTNYVYGIKEGSCEYLGNAGYMSYEMFYYPDSVYPGLFSVFASGPSMETFYYYIWEGMICMESILTDQTEVGPVTQNTKDEVIFRLAGQEEGRKELKRFTWNEICSMGWDAFAAEYRDVTGDAPGAEYDVSRWLGTWTSEGGEQLIVTEATEDTLSLIYHGWEDSGEAMFDSPYTLHYEDEERTVAAESQEVAQLAGYRYVFQRDGDTIIMYSRYPAQVFYRGDAAPAPTPTPPLAAYGEVYTTPFYGIWCGANQDLDDAQFFADQVRSHGLAAQVFLTTDWTNLNTSPWYVVTAGVFGSEAEANAALSSVRNYYPDAYVKYSGDYKG